MKRIISIILCAVCILSLFGCQGGFNSKKRFSETVYDAFDTVTTVTVYDTDSESFKKHFNEFKNELERYDRLYSIYDEYDDLVNLYEINNRASSAPIKADKDIIAMLLYGKESYKRTLGAVNIAMGAVLKLWHDSREYSLENPEKAYVPDKKALLEASKHTDINDLVIDEKNETVFFRDPELLLDAGAVAKGYAAQRISDFLKNGIWSDFAISIGGNVITSGYKNSDGSTKWNIQLESPDKKSSSPEVVGVSGQSVVTSGDYQRFFTVNGKKYCHIIDPETLMPADSFSAVSVITNNSSLGDALSTALFILPLSEGMKLIEGIDGAEAVWTAKGGNKTYSSGFKSYLKQ